MRTSIILLLIEAQFLKVQNCNAQSVCFVRQCNQIISGRNLRYARALQIVQNEEYLQAADFDILRRKRIKRQTIPFTYPELPNLLRQLFEAIILGLPQNLGPNQFGPFLDEEILKREEDEICPLLGIANVDSDPGDQMGPTGPAAITQRKKRQIAICTSLNYPVLVPNYSQLQGLQTLTNIQECQNYYIGFANFLFNYIESRLCSNSPPSLFDDFLDFLSDSAAPITASIGSIFAVSILSNPSLPMTTLNGVPPGQPAPGTPGGGASPSAVGPNAVSAQTLSQALSLVPIGTTVISVFPPYASPRTVPAVSVIFQENSNRRKRSFQFSKWKSLMQNGMELVNDFFKLSLESIKKRRDDFMTNMQCLSTRLQRRKFNNHHGKGRKINSMDDCFDNVSEPLYGFRTKITTEKPCFGHQCFTSKRFKRENRQTGEDFFSEAPPNCRTINRCINT